jgi:CheY-like chemotaxis protein
VLEHLPPVVLIVEDNPRALKLFRLTLEAEGYRVLTAADGAAAVAHLTREPVGLVIQDLVLPDTDGVALLGKLRALPHGKRLPVLVVSGFKTMLDQLPSGPDGFSDSLLKPVSPSELVQLVARYLPAPAAVELRAQQDKTILVVDDEPVQLKLTRLRLEHAGFRVETAADGASAQAAALACAPDAVLCDVLMPDTDGYQLCLNLRSTPALAHVPVVLVSAYYEGARDEALAASVGAAALVTRTPELAEVIAALHQVLAAGPGKARADSRPGLSEQEHVERVLAQLQRQARNNEAYAEKSALQAAQLSILAGVAEALLRSPSMEGALGDVLGACLDAGGISRGAQYKVDAGALVLDRAFGFPDSAAGALQRAFGWNRRVVEAAQHPVVSVRSCLKAAEASALLASAQIEEAVLIPLLEGSHCVGALLLGSDAKQMTEHDLLSFGRAIAAQVAQASALAASFARLREGEEAGRVLSASLDLESTLASLGRLATKRLAERCEVQLEDDPPRVYTRSGETKPGSSDTRETQISVPLVAHRRAQGSLVLIRTGMEPFSDTDRHTAEDLAARASVAIDNARLYQAVRDASRMKDEFLATLSHELRTPLTAILGWARMLLTGLPAVKHEQAFLVIERNALAQVRLIEDLLDTSRIISGNMRLELEPTDVIGVIDAALESAKPALELKRITLRRMTPVGNTTVLGDPQRLQQVIWNLLSNAIKFTPSGGQVTVAVAGSSGHVSISVADTGEGIEASFLDSVFDRFKQADGASTRSHGGLGLGLAITRHLVELHGGSISVHSAGKGRGSLFAVELPVGSVRLNTSAAPALPAWKQDGLVDVAVLIVDDDDDTRELLHTMLAACGMRVTVASSAAEALSALSASHQDVLLSDISMPGEDGYSLIRRLRALPAAQGGAIPAGAITAYSRAEDRAKTLNAGFQLHLSKPVDPAALITAVKTLKKLSPAPHH